MIKEKLGQIKRRGKVPKYTEYTTDDRSRRKKAYDYFICDYCGERIILSEPKNTRAGGTAKISYILTKDETVEVALCNKCVNPALNEFERR